MIESVRPLWEEDGLRLLEHRWTEEMIQLLFSARPHVSPQLLAARAKGRLDHAGRRAGLRLDFSRKLAVRSVGDNSRRDVEAYIERQVTKERRIWAENFYVGTFGDYTTHAVHDVASRSDGR